MEQLFGAELYGRTNHNYGVRSLPIVWGSTGGDTIFGVVTPSAAPSFQKRPTTIVWGNAAGDTIVWGGNCSDTISGAEPIIE